MAVTKLSTISAALGAGLLGWPITILRTRVSSARWYLPFAARTVPGWRLRARGQAAGLAPGGVRWHRWRGGPVGRGGSYRPVASGSPTRAPPPPFPPPPPPPHPHPRAPRPPG